MDQRGAFLADICEHPGDDVPRLIFADWLDDNGDHRRAEFIRVQCQLARLALGDPRRPPLAAREAELWEAAGRRFVAELPDLPGIEWGCECVAFERGFIASAGADCVADLRAQREAVRTFAPLRRVLLGDLEPEDAATLGGPDDPPGLADVGVNCAVDAELLRALAASPLAPRLTSLDLSSTSLQPAGLAALARSPAFGGLRRLQLDSNFGPRNKGGVAETLANSPTFANLTDLSLEYCGLADHDASVLAGSANLTQLERLELWGNHLRATGARAFVEGPERPALAHFSLGSNELGDRGAAALAAWPALSRFGCLHLANNEVSATFIESLADRGLLADIDRIQLIECTSRDVAVVPGLLSVYNNGLSEKGVAALLRSPHRGHLRVLEIWSRSLVEEKASARLRKFFAGDARVR